MNRMTVQSTIGRDGVLHLDLPMGAENADREVQITVEVSTSTVVSQEEWRRSIMEMAGQWQGDFERPAQGDYEVRDDLP